jgi:hypothetical protein
MRRRSGAGMKIRRRNSGAGGGGTSGPLPPCPYQHGWAVEIVLCGGEVAGETQREAILRLQREAQMAGARGVEQVEEKKEKGVRNG